MLEEMLDFFLVLNEKRPNARFLFITKDDKSIIIDKAKRKGIKKEKILVKSSNREMMPSYIKHSNLSIFLLSLYFQKASSPTKMGEIMNLGVPIISNTGIGDVEEIMAECMPELLVNKFTNKEYKRAIDSFLKNKYAPNKIIETSTNYYSLSQGVQKYNEVYEQILL